MTPWNKSSDPLTVFDVSYRPAMGDLEVAEVLQDAFTSGTVLTVAATRPAVDVAKHVEATRASVVIVVDDLHVPQGYLFPDWVTGQVARVKDRSVNSLTDAVKVLSTQSLDANRSHFHEWLNFDRPPLRTCPGRPPDGPHVTFDSIPCSRHR
jgi:hypothetical protein